MKKVLLLALVFFVGFYFLVLKEPVPKYDFKQFNKISQETINALRSELGVHCVGTGAAAFEGVIRSWLLSFDSFGVPSENEALELLLHAREIADRVFRENPAVLPHMHPEYTEAEMFEIEIRFRHLDGSYIESELIFGIDFSRGDVIIWKGEVGELEIAHSEPYEDFLARFPDTTLRAHRLDKPTAE